MGSTRTKKKIHIPKDVMFEIFLKLPVEYLLRLRWLCKYWFKVITDPDFVKMHFNNVHATTNPALVLIKSVRYRPGHAQEFHSLNTMNRAIVNIKAPLQFTSSRSTNPRILGSCNGLLCISCYRCRAPSIFIWNPSTKQYKMIWRFDSTIPTLSSYGFAYDCSTDDYKVIRNVCSFKDNVRETLIDVHTLGTSSSKKLRDNRFYFGVKNGVSINGNLYWKAGLTGSSQSDIIVAFDVAKEEYRQITSKTYINDVKSRSMCLGQLKGCLCVVKVTANCSKSMEVWVMNHNVDDNKKEYSWDILYTISTRYQINDSVYIKPLKFCRNGEFVMVMDMNLILYDPKSKQIRLLPIIRGMKSIETYIESLVPVKGGSYIDGSPSIATIDGPPSIATGKRKREVKRPLRFQDDY